jgi:3-isopropylmalate dehydrogenase
MVVSRRKRKILQTDCFNTICCYALEHFGLHNESLKVHEAVDKAIELNVVTPDLNPYSKFGTNEVGDFIANYILAKTISILKVIMFTSDSLLLF